jgi:hypothetical protein
MTLDGLFRTTINLSAALFGTAVILGLTRLNALLAQSIPGFPRSYFTFETFILNPIPQHHWFALTGSLFIPLLAGLLVGYFWPSDGKAAAAVAGVGAPFLTMWPLLTHWDMLAPSTIGDRFYTFIFLYCIYVAASMFLCRAGALIGSYLSGIFIFVPGDPIVISWTDVAKTAGKGIILFAVQQVLHRLVG